MEEFGQIESINVSFCSAVIVNSVKISVSYHIILIQLIQKLVVEVKNLSADSLQSINIGPHSPTVLTQFYSDVHRCSYSGFVLG